MEKSMEVRRLREEVKQLRGTVNYLTSTANRRMRRFSMALSIVEIAVVILAAAMLLS